jgi:hypothetical protein
MLMIKTALTSSHYILEWMCFLNILTTHYVKRVLRTPFVDFGRERGFDLSICSLTRDNELGLLV